VSGERGPSALNELLLAPAQLRTAVDLPRVRYEIEALLSTFIEAIAPKFAQFSRETKADGDNSGFPELSEYDALGYPGIDAMLARAPRLLERLLQEWLQLEVLELFSVGGPAPGYAFATLESLALLPGLARLGGDAYLVPATR